MKIIILALALSLASCNSKEKKEKVDLTKYEESLQELDSLGLVFTYEREGDNTWIKISPSNFNDLYFHKVSAEEKASPKKVYYVYKLLSRGINLVFDEANKFHEITDDILMLDSLGARRKQIIETQKDLLIVITDQMLEQQVKAEEYIYLIDQANSKVEDDINTLKKLASDLDILMNSLEGMRKQAQAEQENDKDTKN